jgi:hypothetical protein
MGRTHPHRKKPDTKLLIRRLLAINVLASFNAIPPIAGAAMSVSHSNDFHSIGEFPKHDEVGKPLEHHPARTEREFRELAGMMSNSFDSAVKIIQEHCRSPHAAPRIPISCGFGFFQSGRVNSNR